MLKFDQVTKRFGRIVALEDVSFEVADGEFVFLIGPSGAGKTTIMRLILGEFKPTTGEIFVNDLALHNLKKKALPKYRQSIGAVFQDFKLLSTRTIRENIQIALAVKGVHRHEWDSRVDQVLSLVGLTERSELFPSQLSGGELQRASLARALVVNPSFIFADEPTGNLDWETAQGIMDLLEQINKEGKTVIITTHNHHLVEKMNKRTLELVGGKIVKDAKPKGSKKHEHD
jgi:cell division transport system ATP-binding protein